MELWGLTGGIACGKSTVSRMLAERGAAIVDADLLAREVVAQGSEGLAAIVARFGTGVLAPDGALDRRELGARVFSDEEARKDLNAITHPRIAALSAERTGAAMMSGARVVVYDAALLIENGLHQGMNEVIVVACRPATQVERLRRRDGLSDDEARARIHAQMPLDEKRKVATVVLENDGTPAELEKQVDAFWSAVEGRLA